MEPMVAYKLTELYMLEFKICSIREASSSTHMRNSTILEKNTTRSVWLPLYEESKQIVDKYLAEITYLHHVVHIPSVRAIVDDLYQDLNMKNPIKLGQVSLLLAMLASTVFFWTERDMDKPVFSSVAEADAQSKTWMNLTLEVLEYSRFTNSESLEDIQALIIISFLVCNIVGITSQARYLFGTATSMAWQLSLHRIDHPNNAELDLPPPDSVRAEICRRVWWYLVATDWYVHLKPILRVSLLRQRKANIPSRRPPKRHIHDQPSPNGHKKADKCK